MLLKVLVASAGLLVLAGSAPASAFATSGSSGERFTLERSGDGFIRLDRVTGEMSYCQAEAAAGFVCRVAADERAAYETRIRALTDELVKADLRAGKQSLAERKADAAGEISLVEFILKRMLHSAREVAETAEREKLSPSRGTP